MYTDSYEFAPVGYLTLDRKGRIKGANLMAASLLGIGRSRLLQNALLAYLLKEDWLVFQAFLKRTIETPEGQTCEVRVKRKTGDPLWVSVRGERVHGPHGELQEIRLALLDITDRKRLEILEAIRERSQDIPL